MITPIRDEQHWRELRAVHIGASEISTLFGEGFLTPYMLYQLKKGIIKDNGDEILMRFGQLMEPVIAALVVEHYQWDMVKCDEYHEHPDYPWLGCTLDYYCTHPEHGPGIIQIKNVQNFAPGWTQNRAPNYVEMQVQHELFVTNAARISAGLAPFKWTAIASMHAGNPEDIRIMFREQDQRVVKYIIERSTKFWNDLNDSKEPPLMGGADYDHVVDLFKVAEDMPTDYMDFTGNYEFERWCHEYINAGWVTLSAGKTKKEMKTKILHAMMDTSGGQPFRVKTAHTGRVSVTIKFSANGSLLMDVQEVENNLVNREIVLDQNENIAI